MLSSGYGMRHGFIAKYGGEGEMGRAGRGEQGSLTSKHGLHLARVPRPDVLVEVRCSVEHCQGHQPQCGHTLRTMQRAREEAVCGWGSTWHDAMRSGAG